MSRVPFQGAEDPEGDAKQRRHRGGKQAQPQRIAEFALPEGLALGGHEKDVLDVEAALAV